MMDKQTLIPQFLYLGIDPGSSKTGLALVDIWGSIHKLHIARTEKLLEEINAFCDKENVVAIIMGNGTHGKAIAKRVADGIDLPQHIVEEAYSTEEARRLYWKVNPPKGLKALVPRGLLVPPEPLDAYAAVVQVRRWLEELK